MKGDFIKLNYTGKLEGGMVFDTTDKETGQKAGLQVKGEPIVICLGQGHVLPGLDEALMDAPLGKHTIVVAPEKGFGKKNTKLIQLIAASKFKKEKINPYPGLQVNVDNQMGIVKNVSGGRVLVDFNHPLAGQDLTYDVEVLEKVEDKLEQVKALNAVLFSNMLTPTQKDTKIILESPAELPENIQKQISEKIKELVGVDVSYSVAKQEDIKESKPKQD